MILDTQQQRLFDDFISHFEVKKTDGNGVMTAVCPSCRHEKLYINVSPHIETGNPTVLMDCKHNCTFDEIMSAAKLPTSAVYLKLPRPNFEDITQQREHVYTDSQGVPIAKKCITKYLDSYTNLKGQTHKAGSKTTLWQSYDQQTGKYVIGLNGLEMPLYHLHKLSSADTVIIVEGEKDVETLERMGYTATSSPNGAGSKWKTDYNKYLTGKSCIVLTDNDEVGKKAGIQTSESLVKSGIPVKLIRATDIYKDIKKKGDISDIVEVVGTEKAIDLLQNAIANATDYIPIQESKPAPISKTDNYELPEYFELSETTGKLKVNAALLAEHIRKNSHYFFVRNSAFEGVRRYWYNSKNGVYNMVSDSEIQGIIKGYITQYDLPCLKMKYVKDAFLDLTTDLRFIPEDDVNAEEKYINFKNGFMNLLTGELITHTPEIKSTIQLNAEYNPKKKYTLDDAPIFKRYIEDLTECDADKQQLLLEYLGGCLSNISGYRFKKALFLVGESNAGKSQFIKLICELLGKQNFASIGFADLDERFQSGVTYGKRLVCDPDMKIMRAKSNTRFMNMTGGDPISIEFKGFNGFSATYKGFLLFASNDLPKWSGNTTEAAYNRMIILTCNNAIPEDKRDPELLNKMLAERETIICCALSALREAVKRHYTFTIPYDCILTQQELKKSNSPSIDFFTGWCIQYPDSTSNIKHCFKCSEMYLVFTEWCRIYQNGYTPTKRTFRKEILTYLKTDEKTIIRIKDGTPYYKFTLTPEAKEEFRRYDSIA